MVDLLEHVDLVLTHSAERLSLHPLLTYQTIVNDPDKFPITGLALQAWNRGLEIRPFFALMNKPQTLSSCVLTLSGHRDGVNCLDFSHKGGLLVSGGKDGRALVWDIAR